MRSKPVALLLSDLGITKTHSRPYTSDDNQFSESQFATLKYRPDFPDRFGCIEDSRRFAQEFFAWYNTAHHHSGIGLLTPETVHYGLAEQTQKARGVILGAAYEAHPERFNRTLQEEYIDYHEDELLDPERFNVGLMQHLLWHNTERPHWSLKMKPPVQFIQDNFSHPECNMYVADTRR